MASIQKNTRTVTDRVTGTVKLKTSYRVFIRLAGLRPITKTFSSKKLAEAFARRIEGDHEAAEALGGKASALMQSMTLADLIDLYSQEYRGKDQSQLSRLTWWKTHYGGRKLIAIDRDLILDALHTLAQGEGRRAHGRGKTVKTTSTGKPRSPATINRYKATLASVFRFGMNHKLLRLPVNPCRGVPNETEPRGRIRFLSDDERKAVGAILRQCTTRQ
jgi:integrase